MYCLMQLFIHALEMPSDTQHHTTYVCLNIKSDQGKIAIFQHLLSAFKQVLLVTYELSIAWWCQIVLGKWVIIDSNDDLFPVRHQDIT